MKVAELQKFLNLFEGDREVVIHEWNSQTSQSKFYSLIPSCTPDANTKNMVVFIGNGLIKPIRK